MRANRIQVHLVIWAIGIALLLVLGERWEILLMPLSLSILVEASARFDAQQHRTARPNRATSTAKIRIGSTSDEVVANQSVRSGGVEISGSATIMGDVVGRDKIVSDSNIDISAQDRAADMPKTGDIDDRGKGLFVGGDVVGGSKIARPTRAARSLSDWLPSKCPNCGGTLSTATVKNSTATTADCPFCGTQLRAQQEARQP